MQHKSLHPPYLGLPTGNCALIDKTECEESIISVEEAKKFISGEVKPEVKDQSQPEDDADDLVR